MPRLVGKLRLGCAGVASLTVVTLPQVERNRYNVLDWCGVATLTRRFHGNILQPCFGKLAARAYWMFGPCCPLGGRGLSSAAQVVAPSLHEIAALF